MFFLRQFKRLNSLSFRSTNSFGSYYKMVKLFSEVEATSGNKDKLNLISVFKESLSEEERKDFNSLINWYAQKTPIRISVKVINKYYLNKRVQPHEVHEIEPQLAEGGIMKLLSKANQESQLSIYDVNLFLRYLCALQGTGSSTEKAQKILTFGQNVSVLEGLFLLKLIERKLTIGASSKTFKKADQKKVEEEEAKQVKPKKPRKKKEEKQSKDAS